MKKKNIKVFVLILISILVILPCILYFLGFRIVHIDNIHANWNAISSVSTIAGVIVSIFAVFVAILIPKEISDSQHKLDLLDKRLEIYENIREYVSNIEKWECDYGCFLKLRLSSSKIKVYFDLRVVKFYNMLDIKSKAIENLRGDYDHAVRKGECRGKSSEDIEIEINSLVESIHKNFEEIESYIVDKYLTIK